MMHVTFMRANEPPVYMDYPDTEIPDGMAESEFLEIEALRFNSPQWFVDYE